MITEKNRLQDQFSEEPRNRIKGWAALFIWIFCIWGFIFYAGPWLQNSIPVWKELTAVAKEKDIDTTAFFYSENKESYEAERYLRETMDSAKPYGHGFDGKFILGILTCFSILIIGYFFLPNGKNTDADQG
jgi:hypothetical protein